MVHVSDMSWTRKINHPSEMLKKGDEVEANVLEVDRANQRIALGMKQLEIDPWEKIETLYKVGDLVKRLDLFPRINFELLHAERYALVGTIHFEHVGFHFVALLEHFGRMIDLARPGHVRDMHHAVNAFFQFDKRAVAGEVADLAFD